MSDRSHYSNFQRMVSVDPVMRHADDWYSTHPEAAHALVGAISGLLRGATVWECACGDGSLARGLEDAGCGRVIASDLVFRGHGRGGYDFLLAPVDAAAGMRIDWIVTNPPYRDWAGFARHALAMDTAGVALFGPVRYLVGGTHGQAARRARLWAECPPSYVMPFSRRVRMARGGDWGLAASPMMDSAWYVWDRHHPWFGTGPTCIHTAHPHVPDDCWQPEGLRPSPAEPVS